MKIIDVGQTDLIRKKKIGVDLNLQIMREGNRRLDFIQKQMCIRQIGDLT